MCKTVQTCKAADENGWCSNAQQNNIAILSFFTAKNICEL